MPSQITNYQCPACTGPLHYSSKTGKMECEYCGSSFTVYEIEAFYKEKNEQAEEAFNAAAEEANKAEEEKQEEEMPDDFYEYAEEELPEEPSSALSILSWCRSSVICPKAYRTPAATQERKPPAARMARKAGTHSR